LQILIQLIEHLGKLTLLASAWETETGRASTPGARINIRWSQAAAAKSQTTLPPFRLMGDFCNYLIIKLFVKITGNRLAFP
jgi:hypothetical protein